MPLNYLKLNSETRALMLDEILSDIEKKRVNVSAWLSAKGKADWPNLLQIAVAQFDDGWLADELLKEGRLNHTYEKNMNNKRIISEVPNTAHQTLAEVDFNRYYMRAICRLATAGSVTQVEVYRAKGVQVPRRTPGINVGDKLEPAALLEDFRAHTTGATVCGLGSPNSGLSLKF